MNKYTLQHCYRTHATIYLHPRATEIIPPNPYSAEVKLNQYALCAANKICFSRLCTVLSQLSYCQFDRDEARENIVFLSVPLEATE